MIKTEVGDICLPKTIAVINPSNKKGIPVGYIIEKLIEYGGPSIAEEMQEKTMISKKIDLGFAYSTTAGRLYRRKIDFIYHSVIMDYPGGLISPNIVSIALTNALSKAIQDGIESIAIPSFEVSHSRFNKSIIANAMIQVAKKYSERIEIKFIDENPEFIEDLNKYLKVSSSNA